MFIMLGIIIFWMMCSGIYLGVYKSLFGLEDRNGYVKSSALMGGIFSPIALCAIAAYAVGLLVSKFIDKKIKVFFEKYTEKLWDMTLHW